MRSPFPPQLLALPNMLIKRWQLIGGRLVVTLRCQRTSAACSACQAVSQQVHGYYRRQVEDLPCSGRRVTLEIEVRRFRCNNAVCPCRTFAERLSAVAMRHQRRSDRLRAVLWELGLALSGAAGARLARSLGIAVSGETMLRLLKRMANERPTSLAGSPPRIVGVDDWAFRRGHRYGTIFVDLEKQRVLELLPNRDPQTVARWLAAHRQVHIVTRDRAGAYAEGIKRGAPQAIQVADRWHLLKNLGDALERLMSRCHRGVRQTAHEIEQAAVAVVPAPAGRPALTRAQQQQTHRRTRRLARYTQVSQLHQAGMSIRAITRTVALDRRTVRRWLNAKTFPERASRPPVPSKIDAYYPYLRQRWNAGCHNAAQLQREIAVQGYTGGTSLLRRALQAWRHTASARPRSSPLRLAVPSPRRACAWLLKRNDSLSSKGEYLQRFIDLLCRQNPRINTARRLAQDFIAMLRKQLFIPLATWVRQAKASGVVELRQFARGLEHDYEAVRAALETPYSNGRVEGHVNRLKYLKRQMYGRASFELLRIRVLHAS